MENAPTTTHTVCPRRGAFAGMFSGLLGASIGDLGGETGLLLWATIIVVALAAMMILFKFWVREAVE